MKKPNRENMFLLLLHDLKEGFIEKVREAGGCLFKALFVMVYFFTIPVGCSMMFGGGVKMPGKYGGQQVYSGGEPAPITGLILISIGLFAWIGLPRLLNREDSDKDEK
ncbi:MAG: hypothetical protein MI807_02045 [Verrucomicrobiales bacterium]|nr:hypothetical protein [Verrucomicrobiales bacterium]